ncbi:hypothetical protein [Paenibacillus sp. J22TS3]|uniref:hypothetical protein n=1 Tax=Paenibacillus sp. J22TS3 TaxID=2807192 RepID=UPI001B0CFA16|nr:hypothetical protein [Paenibacillus sp. J22TS3]GIP22727.1 hypothetical protein J22TS3_30020 [Paenibacillus sp. J22TS3]
MEEWLTAYKGDMQVVFNEAEDIVSRFPVPFRSAGLDFLDKFHVLKEGRSKNYISYLLPLWLRECSKLSIIDSRRFALANIFGLLYYQLIDDVMDNPKSSPAESLPLASLFQLEFTSIYYSYFPEASPFWDYYRSYLQQWAAAVSREQEENYLQDNPLGMAHKAAPVKLSVASAMLLSNQPGLIAALDKAVDYTLITLQMLDDIKDWKQDLENNNYNSLIAFVRAELGVPNSQSLSEEEMDQTIFLGDCLLRYGEFANLNHIHVQSISEHSPHLRDFSIHMVNELQSIAMEIKNNRNLLIKGGLNYWLTKNV